MEAGDVAVSSSHGLAVTSTATALTTVGNADGVAGSNALIKNTGSVDVFIGGSGVTATTGYQLSAGSTLTATLATAERLYGITASTSGTVDVLQVGV